MSVLYLHTAPPPAFLETDATYQETALLKNRFGGVELSLFPLRKPNSHLPRALYGWHIRDQLRFYEAKTRINHVFAPTLKYYAIFGKLQNPLLMTVQTSIGGIRKPLNEKLKHMAGIVLSNERDLRKLEAWGYRNVDVVRTGVHTQHIQPSWLPIKDKLHLLMASAPWEKSQFRKKGLDLLFKWLVKRPDVHLVLLWRGQLEQELKERIDRMGVGGSVTVINKKVDINDILQQVHATILLASTPDIVKSYPHSLVESLAAGKPVILSRSIPMSDYVEEHGMGIVVDRLGLNELEAGVQSLTKEYGAYVRAVGQKLAIDFSPVTMLERMANVYTRFGIKTDQPVG